MEHPLYTLSRWGKDIWKHQSQDTQKLVEHILKSKSSLFPRNSCTLWHISTAQSTRGPGIVDFQGGNILFCLHHFFELGWTIKHYKICGQNSHHRPRNAVSISKSGICRPSMSMGMVSISSIDPFFLRWCQCKVGNDQLGIQLAHGKRNNKHFWEFF